MLIKKFEGNTPKIDPKAFVAETAVVIGKAEMKEYSSVWYNVTVRGDVNRIEIGRYTNIQDNSVLHVSDSHACIVGDYVTVGHCALLHACTVEDHCLIGMHSTVLDGAVIGKGSIVAAGAVVTKNTIVPPYSLVAGVPAAAGAVVTKNTIVPPYSLVAGVPAKVIKQLPENTDATHAQAVKYENLWTRRYNELPDGGGEEYHGEKIV